MEQAQESTTPPTEALAEATQAPTEATQAPAVSRMDALKLARKTCLDEFRFSSDVSKHLDNLLAQEPYVMVRTRDGSRHSTQWKRTIEKLWELIKFQEALLRQSKSKVKASDKKKRVDRVDFEDKLILEGHRFSRRRIYNEPIFRGDLQALLRRQFNALGYRRVYLNDITKWDHRSQQEYTTFLVKVPV